MNGLDLIAEERVRQIEEEGYSQDDDLKYVHDELAWAAVCYAAPGSVRAKHDVEYAAGDILGELYADPWPWESKWDKRGKHDRKRQLAIAGALIAAELDRIIQTEDPDYVPY